MDNFLKYVHFLPVLVDLGMKAIQRKAESNNQTVEEALKAAERDWNQAAKEAEDLKSEGH